MRSLSEGAAAAVKDRKKSFNTLTGRGLWGRDDLMSPASKETLRLVQASGQPEGPSDDSLMSLAAVDDAGAFATLVTRHQRSVRRLCEVILRDEAQARDVAQQTFLRVWEHRRRYRPRGRFRELLFTMARNESRRAFRRRSVLSFFGLAPQAHLEPAVESKTDDLEVVQTRDLVHAAMRRLPEHFRVPLTLRFVEGLGHEQIAAVIGRTPSAARSRVHYGLKALAALLPEDLSP